MPRIEHQGADRPNSRNGLRQFLNINVVRLVTIVAGAIAAFVAMQISFMDLRSDTEMLKAKADDRYQKIVDLRTEQMVMRVELRAVDKNVTDIKESVKEIERRLFLGERFRKPPSGGNP